jgi:hypothetical protein
MAGSTNAIQLPPPITSGTVAPRQRVKVSVKEQWTDAWTEAPYLEAISATDAVSPTVPQARFRWRSGSIQREGQTQFTDVPAIDLRDWFVKIDLLGQPSDGSSRGPTSTALLWTGRFVAQDIELGGEADDRPAPGDQDLTAYGLAYELDRSVISSSVITNDGSTASYVNVALTFNENYIEGFSEVGNRSSAAITVTESAPARSGYVFADTRNVSDNTPYAWSLKNIIEYLLKFQGGVVPNGSGDQTVPMFTLEADAKLLSALDKLVFPNVRVEGLSVFQVLNELLDRRRGLGWVVRVGTDNKPVVHVFTTIGSSVVVGDALLPANAEASTLTIQGLEHLVRNQQFSLTAGQRYDKIEVTGEPLLACFTVSLRTARFGPDGAATTRRRTSAAVATAPGPRITTSSDPTTASATSTRGSSFPPPGTDRRATARAARSSQSTSVSRMTGSSRSARRVRQRRRRGCGPGG